MQQLSNIPKEVEEELRIIYGRQPSREEILREYNRGLKYSYDLLYDDELEEEESCDFFY